MVVFGQKWSYSGKMFVFRESGCDRKKSGCLRSKWLYSGRSGCFRDKLVVFWQSGFVPAEVFVFGIN